MSVKNHWALSCADPDVASTTGTACCTVPPLDDVCSAAGDGYTYELHTGNADHSDMCRLEGLISKCPRGCHSVSGPPYCVLDGDDAATCHLDLRPKIVSAGGDECLFVHEAMTYPTVGGLRPISSAVFGACSLGLLSNSPGIED
jgi:hypothetical protein